MTAVDICENCWTAVPCSATTCPRRSNCKEVKPQPLRSYVKYLSYVRGFVAVVSCARLSHSILVSLRCCSVWRICHEDSLWCVNAGPVTHSLTFPGVSFACSIVYQRSLVLLVTPRHTVGTPCGWSCHLSGIWSCLGDMILGLSRRVFSARFNGIRESQSIDYTPM